MSDQVVEICRALVRCPSVTPQEGGALTYLEELLRAGGFATHRLRFSEPNTAEVDNLFARIGAGSPHLVFAGHTDVVPPGDSAAWRFDPFSGEVAGGQVWGRGTVDMKGGIAAFAAASLAYIARHGAPKGSLSLLITGDEEGPAINGTDKLLRWAQAQGEKFDHCLVGEPTNPETLGDMIKIGRRGSLTGSLKVHGKQGHVAYPQRANNPIPPLLQILQALIEPALDTGTEHFDATNLEVVTVDVGNPAANVIPAEARARFNVRFNDRWTAQTLQDELARRCAHSASGARYTLEFEPCNSPVFITKPDRFTDLVASAVESRTGRAPVLSTTGGTSDARFIRAYCPVVEFGLVGQTMHMVDEHAAVADIRLLTEIYAEILTRYFVAF